MLIVFRNCCSKHTNKAFLVLNLRVFSLHETLFLGKCPRVLISSMKIVLQKSQRRIQNPVKHLRWSVWKNSYPLLAIGQFCKTLYLTCFDSVRNTLMSPYQKYPNEIFLVLYLKIFIFATKFAVRQIQRHWFQISDADSGLVKLDD